MNFDELFDKIDLWDSARVCFYKFQKRESDKRFSDSVKLAYILFKRGDELFAPFLEKWANEEHVLPDELNLYLYLRFTENLYEQYKINGYPDEVFYDSVKALDATCRTHYKRCGVCGVLQPRGRRWFRTLFSLSVFRLGRLEFELIPALYDVELDGEKLRKGELCVTTHIPAYSKLDEELCEKSYSRAREFFKTHFGIEKLFFFCDSWLLHPWLSQEPGEESRIVKFQKKYKLLKTEIDENEVIERVFTKFCDNVDDYPENTSLQKIVKERLKKNLPLGTATGVRL